MILPGWIVADPVRLTAFAESARSVLPIAAAVKLGAFGYLIHRVGSRRLYAWSRVGWVAVLWLTAVAVCCSLFLRYVPDGVTSIRTALSTVIVLLPPCSESSAHR